jgi:hypothetical protein
MFRWPRRKLTIDNRYNHGYERYAPFRQLMYHRRTSSAIHSVHVDRDASALHWLRASTVELLWVISLSVRCYRNMSIRCVGIIACCYDQELGPRPLTLPLQQRDASNADRSSCSIRTCLAATKPRDPPSMDRRTFAEQPLSRRDKQTRRSTATNSTRPERYRAKVTNTCLLLRKFPAARRVRILHHRCG